MILQKTLKHAMKWSLVLLTKYKKCSIVNASHLDHCSCMVSLNIYLLMYNDAECKDMPRSLKGQLLILKQLGL